MTTAKITSDEKSARFEAEAVPHFLVLKRLALHLTRNQSEAEDLVQETFIQALISFERYESGTNCRAWLCKIMFYKRAQWIRKNARYCQFDEGESQFPSVTYATLLPSNFISKRFSLALLDLPEKFRNILWLAVVEEFTYREISGQLSIPLGTVMSRLHRGRKMLRDKFTDYANNLSPANVYN